MNRRSGSGRAIRAGRGWAQRSGRACQPSVRGDQFAVQVLGQRGIAGVVGADIGSQFDGTRDQSQRRHALKAELLQVRDGGAETLLSERAMQPALAQHRHGLDVDQVGRGDLSGGSQLAAGILAVLLVVGEGIGQDGCGYDDHHVLGRMITAASVLRPGP